MQQTMTETLIRNQVIFETVTEEKITEDPQRIKWTQEHYYRMAELGFFQGKKVELIEGEIIETAPMKSPHATSVSLVGEVLRESFGKVFYVRSQLPLSFSKDNEPEPDVIVVKGNIRDFTDSHPKTADLVVEISDATLRYDRVGKMSLYAKYKIKDYWIVSINDKRLEIYRRPIKDKTAIYGFSYAEILIFTENDEVSPLAAPDAKIKVADLLP